MTAYGQVATYGHCKRGCRAGNSEARALSHSEIVSDSAFKLGEALAMSTNDRGVELEENDADAHHTN
jgi:hypothetical protein